MMCLAMSLFHVTMSQKSFCPHKGNDLIGPAYLYGSIISSQWRDYRFYTTKYMWVVKVRSSSWATNVVWYKYIQKHQRKANGLVEFFEDISPLICVASKILKDLWEVGV